MFKFISLACLLFFSYPLLSIGNRAASWMHIPVFYWYIFLGWIAFIIGIALTQKKSTRQPLRHE